VLSFDVEEVTPNITGFSTHKAWSNAVFKVSYQYDGWTRVFFVCPGTMLCCGMGHLQKISSIIGHSKENLQEIYDFLKKSFGPTNKDKGRISDYKHNQLFCTHADGMSEKYPLFMEVFKVRKEMTWQSASEPNHRTALYSINFV